MKRLLPALCLSFIACIAQADSRTVTIGFSPCHADSSSKVYTRALVANAADWVSNSSSPSSTDVLLVRGYGMTSSISGGYTDACDSVFIKKALNAVGYSSVTVVNEGASGLKPTRAAGYDVIVYIGDSWPVHHIGTVRTLADAALNGVGLILTGDDVSWHTGSATYPDPTYAPLLWQFLTRLEPVDNGPGGPTETITLTATGSAHAVMTGPHGTVGTITTLSTCSSGSPAPCNANDVDTTVAYPSAVVLAESSGSQPAVVAAELK